MKKQVKQANKTLLPSGYDLGDNATNKSLAHIGRNQSGKGGKKLEPAVGLEPTTC